MDLKIKNRFIIKWEKYFKGNDLPIACFYSDKPQGADFPKAPRPNKRGYTCIFSQLAPVRTGKPRAFNQENIGSWGASATLGFGKEFTQEDMDHMVDFDTIDPHGVISPFGSGCDSSIGFAMRERINLW